MKTLSRYLCLALVAIVSFSFVSAETGTLSVFSTKYTLLQQQFSSLSKDFSQLPDTNNVKEMTSLLACMDIPVPTNEETYQDIFKKLQSDFTKDFPNLSASGSTADEVRLEFYIQSLNSLKTSLTKDRSDRALLLQGVVAKNQKLFNQLSADKKLLDNLFTSYTDWSKAVVQYRALYGYTVDQYNTIVDDYATLLKSGMDKRLSTLQASLLKKNSSLIALPAFAEQQRDFYNKKFALDVDAFFSKELGGIIPGLNSKEYKSAIDSIQETFYTNGMLQCGLLTSLTQDKKTYYQSLLTDLSIQTLTIKKGSAATGDQMVSLFSSGSMYFTLLSQRYSNTSKTYQNLYMQSLSEYMALLAKAISYEKNALVDLNALLLQYNTAVVGSEKSSIKETLVNKITQLERGAIVSTRTQQSLETIKKALNLTSSLQPKPRVLKKIIKK